MRSDLQILLEALRIVVSHPSSSELNSEERQRGRVLFTVLASLSVWKRQELKELLKS